MRFKSSQIKMIRPLETEEEGERILTNFNRT